MPTKPASGVAFRPQPGRRGGSLAGRVVRCHRWLRDARQGVTSLEFALIGVPLMTMLLGTIDLSRYLITLDSVRTVAAEAARTATLRGSRNMNASNPACTNLAGALGVEGVRTPFLNASSLTVTMAGCGTVAGVTTVTVTVTYPFAFTVPYFGARNRPITETVQGLFH